MNDLLSELNCLDEDSGSTSKKRDGSSSPLRPNPKYCAIVQPSTRSAAARATAVVSRPAAVRPAQLSGSNFIPISGDTGPRQSRWDKAQGSATTPVARIPETVQKIMATAATGSGMEVDDDAQFSDRSSSPLKPNEKYCTIVTPSRSRVVARVAPQPVRHVQPAHRDAVWIPKEEVDRGRRRSASPHRHRNPDPPDRTRVAPPHYSNPMHPMGPYPSGAVPYPHHYSLPFGPGVYSNPFGPGGYLPYYDQPYHGGYNGPDYGRHPGHVKQEIREERRDMQSTAVRTKDRESQSEWKKRREAEDEKRRLSNERRHEKERKKRIEEEKELRWRKAEEEERSRRERTEKEKRGCDAERRARSQLKSFSVVHPKREVSTVSMTREELEELKAKCKAEGEQKALADARKAEAVARLESCLQKAEERKNEPEPMEVEESDMVESSIPASSSNTSIAPIPLIIKTEPEEETEPRADNRKKEIPTVVVMKEVDAEEKEVKDRRGKGEDKSNRVVKKEVDDEIEIIEKPPAEMVTLSDDEGTVTADSQPMEKRDEDPSASKPVVEEEEELWVIATKRGRKKNTVFDLSKVKKEEEVESGSKVRDSSEPSIPFNASKVKAEPADSRTSIAAEVRSDTVPHSGKVKTEAVDDGARGDTVADPTVALMPARPPSQPLPDYNEEDVGSVPPRPVQQLQPIGEEQPQPVQQLQPIGEEGTSVDAALAAARRLIRQIGETVHSQHHHQPQQLRPVRQPLQVHQPSPGSFLHWLRIASRKRRLCCDEDEDEWIAKRARIEEEEEEEEKDSEDQ